ncbi:hypothetical protein F2P81_007538 [Scophthalmus maximus]|uniref:F-BAR domain-containing protein n=1 Tax=Scophthalmus maximus TaxID=52904 RepID=A0A6A4SZM5_SCOMX|nr:hypothetical protein F2P81_007538 [Scophthalmus maximus]
MLAVFLLSAEHRQTYTKNFIQSCEDRLRFLAMSEFNKDVKRFGECVKEYGFLNHSIAGLKSLHPNNSCHNSIEPLISHLEVMVPSDLVKESQQVKLVFSEQLSKLQTKQNQDTELLEEIRSFSKHRAAIEKEYGQLQRVQGEVVDALRELHRLKKSYHQLSHIASVAREKAADAQARARKSEHGIFHFKTGLHKMTAKLSARLKECDDRFIEVRNDYLLALAAVNAHHQNYHTNDLPRIMEQMDGDVYEDLRSHFTLLCGTEMDSCLSTHKQYSKIWDSLVKVTREKNIQQFLQETVAFSKTTEFHFQPAPGDKALQMLESRLKLLSGETGLSVEQRIVEMQDSVRKAKDEFELTDFEDFDDENVDIFADPGSASGVCLYPAACRVIYSYQASQSDELSIMEGEELQVIEDGDMEDWLKSLSTPTMPPFSPSIPISTTPGCSSALNATSPSCVEDKQQAVPLRLADVTVDTGASNHTSPDLSSSRLRPCRAPPPPPTLKPSPQP